MAFTKVIVNKQLQYCICAACGGHIPIKGPVTVGPKTVYNCLKCKAVLSVTDIVEQTVNISVDVVAPTPFKKGEKVVFRRGTVKENIPMKTMVDTLAGVSETKKKAPLVVERDTDIVWNCKICNSVNFELMVENGEKINCVSCGSEITVLVK